MCLLTPLSGPLCFCLQIKLWDLRTTKCVKQYGGHVNEYALLPLHVHEEEGIMVAGTEAGKILVIKFCP